MPGLQSLGNLEPYALANKPYHNAIKTLSYNTVNDIKTIDTVIIYIIMCPLSIQALYDAATDAFYLTAGYKLTLNKRNAHLWFPLPA